MKICVDVQSAVSQRAGIGRYTRILVDYLDQHLTQHELLLFYFDFQRRAQSLSVRNATVKAVHWCPGAIAQQAWKRIGFPPFDSFSGKADLFHFPNFTMPPLRRGKSVVTMHDMSFARFPEFAEAKNLANLKARIPDSASRADAIITISDFSAGEIETLLKVPREKIHAIPLGIGPEFTRAPDEAMRRMRERHGLKRPYILFVGTIEPRKNISFLVDVFDQLKEFDGDLVIVGHRGWTCGPTLARIAASPRKDRIRLLESIGNDGELSAIYSAAELFVIPSFYEGFGFPPLEAMACGTPVVSSSGGSLPETVGQAAPVIKGFDLQPWTDMIMQMIYDQDARKRYIALGLKQAARFSWTTTAERTRDVYEKVLGT